MKKIALTQRLIENESYPEIRDALDVRWGSFLEQAGLLPVPITTGFSNVAAFFEELEITGVILTGGNNLSLWTKSALSRQRDEFEKKLLALAVENRIKVLGVCRGAQLIADFFGAKFEQVNGHVATRHRLQVANGSRYQSYIERLREVNSYHAFSISHVSNDLRVDAISEDGVIEAIEHKIFPIFGQMWHPEREDPFKQQDLAIFQELFS